jgi:hypothetical protein
MTGMASGTTASRPAQHDQQATAHIVPRGVLSFHVVFSPFSPIAANNQRDPSSPFALGDELVFHDQLSAKGKQIGDDVGSCVIAAVTPQLLANCSLVIRLPKGNLAGQFVAIQGPEPKQIALTGGTGSYRAAGGDGTLVEFGNGEGRLTLQVLSLVSRGKDA